MSDNHRLDVLEQKLTVMQREVSEVIGEMHQGLTAMMNSLRMMAQTYNARLAEVEKLLPEQAREPLDPAQPIPSGKEL